VQISYAFDLHCKEISLPITKCTENIVYKGYWVSFPGVKSPGRGDKHAPSSGTEVKERVELYVYTPLGLRGLYVIRIFILFITLIPFKINLSQKLWISIG
jgi:hypothetical protein